MDELIIRLLQGEATPRQREDLSGWRKASAANEARFREVREIWEVTGRHEEVDRSVPVPEAHEVVPGRPLTVVPGNELPKQGTQRAGVGGWSARAAALAAALVLGVAVGQGFDRSVDMGLEFHTDPGQMTTATLSDGTVVRLAPSSRLQMSAARGVRDVWLEGRAFFSVAHDPGRPFMVRGPAGDARVLGTRFDMENRGDDLRLLVLEGRVAIEAPEGAVEVGAGELAEARRGTVPSVVRVEDPEGMVAWLGVFMVFEATPLEQVARELESRLGIRLEFTDPALAERTVTGWFGQEVREDLVPILCRIAGVECAVEGSVVQMSP